MCYSTEQLAELIAGDLAEGFERELFQASLEFVRSGDSPLRFNAFAFSLRELLRHVRERLAPIEHVKAAPWFKQDPNIEEGRVTRRQGWMYAIQKKLAADFVLETLGIDLTETLADIKDSENELSKLTHVNPPTFNLDSGAGDQLVHDSLVALWSVFDSVSDACAALVGVLSNHIQAEVISCALRETNRQVDLLSSNSIIEHTQVDDWHISAIDHTSIRFEGEGTASVRLEWGRGDDHAEIAEEFPFTFKGSAPTSAPESVRIEADNLVVDTASWFDE